MYRKKDFAAEYARIKKRNRGCWEYLEEIGVENWSRAHFAGERYNLMSSNIAESLNNALIPARGSPVVALLEFSRKMLARWFESRRKKILRTVGDIPIAVERELLKRFKGGLGMGVLAVGEWDFEVTSKDGKQFLVSVKDKTCSCMEFQKLKFPCTHAMAAAHDRGLEYMTLVGQMYRISTWTPTVGTSILHVQDPAEVSCLLESSDNEETTRETPEVAHPLCRRGNNKSRQPNKCGRCGGFGHNRVTCTAPLR
ncbi:PREDICTED: uncharacterized protein LOC104763351 [Camelina sativa]|uniref:Uncharacterized protein LOC104763351 n=1 Tax=Camelina sativa TaxID=90675 RepID=A0ABM0XF51_CAMSA|nr:PREDICTED: uncharacterized protein LOC104763351 [Camelina sativa]